MDCVQRLERLRDDLDAAGVVYIGALGLVLPATPRGVVMPASITNRVVREPRDTLTAIVAAHFALESLRRAAQAGLGLSDAQMDELVAHGVAKQAERARDPDGENTVVWRSVR